MNHKSLLRNFLSRLLGVAVQMELKLLAINESHSNFLNKMLNLYVCEKKWTEYDLRLNSSFL